MNPEKAEKWDYQELLKAIQNTFELLARNENLIREHQKAGSPQLIIQQYQDLKTQYTLNLLELLKEMNISVKLVA